MITTIVTHYTVNLLTETLKPKASTPTGNLLGGSWDLVRKVIRTLIGLILASIVTLIIAYYSYEVP